MNLRTRTARLRYWMAKYYQFYRWQGRMVYSPAAIVATICFFITLITWGPHDYWGWWPQWVADVGRWTFAGYMLLFVLGMAFLHLLPLSWGEMDEEQRRAYTHFNPNRKK